MCWYIGEARDAAGFEGGVGVYPCAPGDLSLAPMNETRAWWQSSMAYANTALMKNLRPWIVRKFAIPVVSFYLHR